MKRFNLTEFSVNRPLAVIIGTALITIGFLLQFPKITVDTDPKNMLPADSKVRVYNDSVEKTFGLHKDTIVLAVVNKNGIFNHSTLEKISRITDELVKLDGVVIEDVISFTTVDDIVSQGDFITVKPLMDEAPSSPLKIEEFKKSVYSNPLVIDRLVSKDGTVTAIYVPLKSGANGKEIADKIKLITDREKGAEAYYIAGDPVTRDTFGAEMFKQMGLFSPIAGLIMFITLYILFRNLSLISSVMAVAMISIVWSMGLLIGLGYPVHIMSSMIPVFLMAIATDSIHIFNEFYFRIREVKDKKQAILDTMKAVGEPVKYTALATAAGFGVLTIMHIIPVKVFGIGVAFGTIAIRLMSFSLIPSVMMLVSKEKILTSSESKDESENKTSALLIGLAKIAVTKSMTVVIVAVILLTIAAIGISRINLNNNMVKWFKAGSAVRISDGVINEKLGGTATAYLVVTSEEDDFIKRPATLRYIDTLQRELEDMPQVGKTFSIVDYVKRINMVFNDNNPSFDSVPQTAEAVSQYLFMFSMSAKPSDLDKVVDYRAKLANITVQLKSWDAAAIASVIARVKAYTALNPLNGVEIKPAGAAYFNLVWNNEVLYDMLKGFILAVIIVFVILVFNFRSLKWALIAYMPLLFTIAIIYGVIGLIGKDFDMPISVLSCLSLGMAVDFAIHFITRFRKKLKEGAGMEEALLWTAARPGKGIIKNAILFAAAFLPMIFAPLTPYATVGLFIVSMMFLSAALSIILLPALIVISKSKQ